MEEHDQYESIGLDDSLEDDRDFDQIMEDRRAAEMELEAREGRVSVRNKLPQMLFDQGNFTLFRILILNLSIHDNICIYLYRLAELLSICKFLHKLVAFYL